VQSGEPDVFCPLAHRPVTFARNDSTLERHACLTLPNRSPCLGTTFRSQEKTARFRATFPRSMLLAYPFGSPQSLYQARSILLLLHACWLAPDGANSMQSTRCLIPSLRPRPFFSFSLPIRALWTPPDQSAKLNTNRKARHIGTSRLSFAPRCLLFLIGPAADQCSGLAFVPPAYCLTNLLEPSSLCSRMSFASIEKYWFRHTFAQLLVTRRISELQRRVSEYPVDKPRTSGFVLTHFVASGSFRYRWLPRRPYPRQSLDTRGAPLP